MRYCDTLCPHGGVCTLEEGHDGDHFASSSAGGGCSFSRSDADERVDGVVQSFKNIARGSWS